MRWKVLLSFHISNYLIVVCRLKVCRAKSAPSLLITSLSPAQKNKATSYHVGQLKAKLAKLRRELIAPSTSSGGGGGLGFDVARSALPSSHRITGLIKKYLERV